MRIRAMTEADLDPVLAIAAALQTAPHWPRSDYAAALGTAGMPRRIGLVAELPAESAADSVSGPELRIAGFALAGFAVASLVAGEGEIESIAVAAGAQRQGVGLALLVELIRALEAEGARNIVLEVRESNRAAAALYAQAGFHEAGRRRAYYRDPVEDAVLMRLEMARVTGRDGSGR